MADRERSVSGYLMGINPLGLVGMLVILFEFTPREPRAEAAAVIPIGLHTLKVFQGNDPRCIVSLPLSVCLSLRLIVLATEFPFNLLSGWLNVLGLPLD